ncbi:MAG: hypothetical protein NTZ74_04405 [Chloroflexi bacterium]|nr:hypothetical protein [Chloroflexota bacterium]
MKYLIVALSIMATLCLAACQTDVCPEGSITYMEDVSLFPAETGERENQKTEVQIGQKMIEVDRVIHGPLCNDTWEGTVYVACDVQVKKWEDKPDFLEGCNLKVSSDAVVYVAAHNNTPYYKGCDECH